MKNQVKGYIFWILDKYSPAIFEGKNPDRRQNNLIKIGLFESSVDTIGVSI